MSQRSHTNNHKRSRSQHVPTIKQEEAISLEDECMKDKVDTGRLKFLMKKMTSAPIHRDSQLKRLVVQELKAISHEYLLSNLVSYFIEMSKLTTKSFIIADIHGDSKYLPEKERNVISGKIGKTSFLPSIAPSDKGNMRSSQANFIKLKENTASELINRMYDRNARENSKNVSVKQKADTGKDKFAFFDNIKIAKSQHFPSNRPITSQPPNLFTSVSPMNSPYSDERLCTNLTIDDEFNLNSNVGSNINSHVGSNINSHIGNDYNSLLSNINRNGKDIINGMLGKKRAKDTDAKKDPIIKKLISLVKKYPKCKGELLGYIEKSVIAQIDRIYNEYSIKRSKIGIFMR
jgi:hypothetical protein